MNKITYATTTATVTKNSLEKLIRAASNFKFWQIFLDLNSKGLMYRSLEKEKRSRCPVFKSSTKLEILVKSGSFTSLSCSDCKEIYKRVCCTCKVVVFQIYTYIFFAVRRRRRLCLSTLLTDVTDMSCIKSKRKSVAL